VIAIDKISVRCEPESLETAKSGAIWGNVWLDCSATAFPEVGWSDLAVSSLTDLGLAVTSLRLKGGGTEFRFFDGPFSVNFSVVDDDEILVVLKESERRIGYGQVNRRQFVATLLECGKAVLAECVARNWSDSSEVRELERVMASLAAMT
jgi:hypothetical protein